MTVKHLDRIPYAQAKVIIDDNGAHLISYATLVCTIDNAGWLSCTGTYSSTTRKHISANMGMARIITRLKDATKSKRNITF